MSFDLERALAEIARNRANDDPLTRRTAALAAKMASGTRGDFAGVLDMETVGTAYVVAAASVVPLCSPDIPAAVIVNIIAMAGADLIEQARREGRRG